MADAVTEAEGVTTKEGPKHSRWAWLERFKRHRKPAESVQTDTETPTEIPKDSGLQKLIDRLQPSGNPRDELAAKALQNIYPDLVTQANKGKLIYFQPAFAGREGFPRSQAEADRMSASIRNSVREGLLNGNIQVVGKLAAALELRLAGDVRNAQAREAATFGHSESEILQKKQDDSYAVKRILVRDARPQDLGDWNNAFSSTSMQTYREVEDTSRSLNRVRSSMGKVATAHQAQPAK